MVSYSSFVFYTLSIRRWKSLFAIKLCPAYRHGADTPWGGDGLARLFQMEIPSERTGEALVASTLPGLESRTLDGRTLTELAGGTLPLLLKLLCARETLSVQVHPSDEDAKALGEAARGKGEAWVILDAVPGAQVAYGLLPGTDIASLSPKELSAHLSWMEVKAGDALYIPPGMVHAIGGGITLYEIQQASDLTYRLWDWERKDAKGRERALHLTKARAVIRPQIQLTPTQGIREEREGGHIIRYFQTEHFALDRMCAAGALPLPARQGFAFLTALTYGKIARGDEKVAVSPGDTLYIPPKVEGISLMGPLECLVSGEGTLR